MSNSKIVVPSKALSKLHCTLCNEYLSQLPVYIYPEQGAVCGRCPVLQDQNPLRAKVYEDIAELLLFPCRHHINGCLEQLLPATVQEHEESCIYRTYFCPSLPLGLCPWQGPSKEVLAHFEEKHPIFILKDAQFEIDFVSKYNENYLLPYEEELFLVHTKFEANENTFWCSVRYIGPKCHAEEYLYEITLKGGNSSKSYSFDKKSVESDIEVNIDKNTAVQINAELIKNTLEDPPYILCNISISKNENTKEDAVIEEITNNFKTTVAFESADENILRELECPVCNEYMVPPIHQCVAGHSICNVCKEQIKECPTCRGPIQDTRNFVLERMTSHIKYTCKYVENGCAFVSSSKEIRQHESTCTFGPYDCPLKDYNACSWQGKSSEIMEHVRYSHDDNIVDSGSITVILDECDEDEDCFILSEFGQIFRLHYKCSKNNFYWAMQFIGPPEESYHFYFEIDFMDQSDDNQRLFIKRPVSTSCPDGEVFDDGKSFVVVPYALLSPMIIDGDLNYRVRIVKA